MFRPALSLAFAATLLFATAGQAAPSASPAPRAATLMPAHADGLLAQARTHQAAGRHAQALAAAKAAASAYDAQVELHKQLSDAILDFELVRAERASARRAALARDEAFWITAESARALGDVDTAIRHYAMVAQSQPDRPLGEQALAALAALGFLASPLPSPTPAP